MEPPVPEPRHAQQRQVHLSRANQERVGELRRWARRSFIAGALLALFAVALGVAVMRDARIGRSFAVSGMFLGSSTLAALLLGVAGLLRLQAADVARIVTSYSDHALRRRQYVSSTPRVAEPDSDEAPRE